MKWHHPKLGEVGEMRHREQEIKGWKHLYDPQERWDQLIDVPSEKLQSQSRANGCKDWRRGSKPAPARPCRACLRRHHDDLWRSAYGEALMAPASRIGRDPSWRGNPIVLASPRGIWLVLTPDGKRVFDAFRPHPYGQGVNWKEPDFVEQTYWRFDQITGAPMRDRSLQLRREVTRPVDAWHLALVVGAALAARQPTEVDALQDAIVRLQGLPLSTRLEALPRQEDLLDGLERALDESCEDPEEATTAVLAVEDALVAYEILLGGPEAERLREAVEELVAWAPESWLDLTSVVGARRQETVGVAQAWWETVDEVLGALLVSEAETVHTPSSFLAERLTAAPWWQDWMERLAELPHRMDQPAALGLHVAASHLDVVAGPWDVSTDAPLASGVQVFVVDQEFPLGESVTKEMEQGGLFWQLENPGQEAWFVRIEGVATFGSLASALAAASQEPGAVVTVVKVSRPS